MVTAPRTPSGAMLRSPMLGRAPMFGSSTPARSPANSTSAGTRTPGAWTPTILSPRSPAFPAYASANSNSNSAGGSAYPYSSFPLSSGGITAAAAGSAARDGGGGGGRNGSGRISSGRVGSGGIGSGGIGSGGIGSLFDAIPGPLPMEEDAIRKSLGLPPTNSRGNEGSHRHGRRYRPSRGDNNHESQQRGGYGVDGSEEHFQGDEGQANEEGGGQSERKWGEISQAPGGAPLCLLLSNLGELFRWDAAAAADICADAFPGVRPW